MCDAIQRGGNNLMSYGLSRPPPCGWRRPRRRPPVAASRPRRLRRPPPRQCRFLLGENKGLVGRK